jgi:hypothetical protein
MRRRLGVPFLLALGGLSWAGVHMVAHRLAGSGGHAGHGHMEPAAGGYLSTSLTLCLSLALVLAATSSVYPRRKGISGRAVWLFAAVPLLGLFAGAVVDAGGSLGGLQANVAELLPVAALVLIVQVAVAFSVVRVARGLLDVVAAALHALAVPRPTGPVDDLRSFFAPEPALVRASHAALAAAPRGPPSAA